MNKKLLLLVTTLVIFTATESNGMQSGSQESDWEIIPSAPAPASSWNWQGFREYFSGAVTAASNGFGWLSSKTSESDSQKQAVNALEKLRAARDGQTQLIKESTEKLKNPKLPKRMADLYIKQITTSEETRKNITRQITALEKDIQANIQTETQKFAEEQDSILSHMTLSKEQSTQDKQMEEASLEQELQELEGMDVDQSQTPVQESATAPGMDTDEGIAELEKELA